MLNVSFHIQPDHDVLLPEHFMIQVLCHYVDENHKVCVMCNDTTQAAYLSKHVWSFPPNKFIPHNIKDNMIITEGPFEKKCIVNMTNDCILNMKIEIIELVFLDENNKLQARNRFKTYKKNGFNLKHIKGKKYI